MTHFLPVFASRGFAMPQKPVGRRAGNRYMPPPPPRPPCGRRLGWDTAVTAMIEERGPQGARAFGGASPNEDQFSSAKGGDAGRRTPKTR